MGRPLTLAMEPGYNLWRLVNDMLEREFPMRRAFLVITLGMISLLSVSPPGKAAEQKPEQEPRRCGRYWSAWTTTPGFIVPMPP
jgi:hypothetical protein